MSDGAARGAPDVHAADPPAGEPAGGPTPTADDAAPPGTGAPEDVLDEAPRVDPAGALGEAHDVSVEELLSLVETLTAERDENYQARARLQAEFENYRKRAAKEAQEQSQRVAERLVSKLLPALDAFDAALAHQVEGVEQLYQSLWSVLEPEGVEKLDPVGQPFDPNAHEAVMHEEGEGGDGEHGTVVQVLRPGYAVNGRVVRPAMVKVRT